MAHEVPFVALSGGYSLKPPADAAHGYNPLLIRVAGEMYLERLDYEPTVKQLRRMAKCRSLSGPVHLSTPEQAAVRSARRHSFCGDLGIPSPQISPRATRLATLPEKADERRPIVDPDNAALGAEADSLIASLRVSFRDMCEPSQRQPTVIASRADNGIEKSATALRDCTSSVAEDSTCSSFGFSANRGSLSTAVSGNDDFRAPPPHTRSLARTESPAAAW
mmetsp:Transcript_33551/g.85722  ORF Transcript_33551/g.85722 Transcript_33551/m.85722 type:complete len:221 (+) Transcript_33551:323-985(+)